MSAEKYNQRGRVEPRAQLASAIRCWLVAGDENQTACSEPSFYGIITDAGNKICTLKNE